MPNGMISPLDTFGIRQDSQGSRGDYRPVHFVSPQITTGSGYEQFTDAPFDVSAPSSSAYGNPTFLVYQTQARVKIITAEMLVGGGIVVPGVALGDYLLYMRLEDEEMVRQIIANEHGYALVDGVCLRPDTVNFNGVAKLDDVTVHCKIWKGAFRATGL